MEEKWGKREKGRRRASTKYDYEHVMPIIDHFYKRDGETAASVRYFSKNTHKTLKRASK